MTHFFSFIKNLILVLSLWLVASTAHATVHWTKLARQVGQNERNHQATIRQLREIKDLDQILLKALETPQRALALDVISALQLEAMLPELLERVAADEDGFLVLTLNSLLNTQTKARILDAYVENLRPGRPPVFSAAAITAMLEPLGRLGVPLSKEALHSLLSHEYPEVRASVIEYTRLQLLRHGKRENAELVMKALKMQPAQLRAQALYLIDEMAAKPELAKTIDFALVTETCKNEKNQALQRSLQKKCLGFERIAKGEK